MTSFTLLMICIAAQILIAGGLGIYLFRSFSRKRREGKTDDPPEDPSSREKK